MKNREMTAGHWRALEAVFDAALELPAPERTALLAAQETALRREVEVLLAAREQAEDFLCQPAAQLPAVLTERATGEVNEQIGPYRLLRQLGGGGMGVVWLAERADGQFKQQVALKLIQAGRANEAIQQRFLHERQILAGLQHPHIARLTDGGVAADGRPFFVMEYIAGAPLDAYCREQQLGLNERLRLFLQVCAAVQYAHQHLVIHRDLKPGNILVTADGAPKLLDFGIAKLVQPAAAQSFETLPGAQPMTPAYASPEQVRGEKLTTASDVYALGVVLYELLAGRGPYRLQTDTLGELTRAICEQEPVKPSLAVERMKDEGGRMKKTGTLHPSSLILHPSVLRGDLDSIVLMALRKETQARYQSVEQFAEDIRRYLDGLPTLARRGTFGYRALKYARRNRVPLAAAALVGLSLLGGIGATWRQARIALVAQARAEDARVNADTQRQRAEAAFANAEERRRQAETARNEANEQRAEAETQREQANEQSAFADEQRQRAETQELSNRRLLYTSRMNLAQQAWDVANISRMRDLLNPYVSQASAPDLRGFEWHYLWRLSHQEERTLPDSIVGGNHVVAFTADGTQLVAVSGVGAGTNVPLEVVMTDLSNWQERQRFNFPPATIAALSRDRTLLALGRHGRPDISVVSLVDGKELSKLAGLQGGLSCLDFAAGGKQLVAGFYDGALSLIDLPAGRELYHNKAHPQRVFTVAVAPDGRQFVTGSVDRTARLWTLASGKEIRTLGKELYPPQNSLYSPDGRLVVISGMGITTAWETASGKELAQLRGKGRRLVFTPDSRTLLIGGEDGGTSTEISLLDTETWQSTGTIRGHGHWIIALAVTPDGQHLASGSLDKTVKVWNLNRVRETPIVDDFARKWGDFKQLVVTPDGKRALIAQGDQSATLWDVATRKEVITLRGHKEPPPKQQFNFAVAVSADGRWFATGGYLDGQVKLWDAASGKELRSYQADLPIDSVSLSPDGRVVAAGSGKQVWLWETSSGKLLHRLTGHTGLVIGLQFAPASRRLFSAGNDGIVRAWDSAGGQVSQEYRCGLSITSFALSRDGRLFVIANNGARLWDVQSGRELLAFKGHTGGVTAVAFSPDGRRLVTGSQDRTVRMWDVSTGEELIVLNGHRSWIATNGLAFAPDGRSLVSAEWLRRLFIWRTANEQEVRERAP